MRSSFVKFSMLTYFGFLDCFYTIGGQLISGIDRIRKCLYRSGSRSRPRQGPKPGRKRRWRGFPGAPSGAGRGVSPRVPRIGAELGAWSRLRPADEARGRRGRGDMFGRGSYTLVRRCKSSIFSVAIQSAVEVSFAAVIKLNRNETAVERLYVNRSVCETEGSSARPKCIRIRGLPPETGNNT